MTNQPETSVVSLNKTASSTTVNNANKLDFIRDEAVNALIDLLKGMFDGVDDSFFELANVSRNNNEQNRYFEAMREVRIKRRGIETNFRRSLTDAFRNPAPSNSSFNNKVQDQPDNLSYDNLTLVQNDDLEEEVALRTMCGKANANFNATLIQLNARFKEFFKREQNLNPLDPSIICKAFSDACHPLDLEIRERLIVYKQFDRFVLSNISSILEACNLLLIKMGLLPDLKFTSNKTSVSPKSSNIPNANPTTTRSNQTLKNNKISNYQPVISQINFTELQNLLHIVGIGQTNEQVDSALPGSDQNLGVHQQYLTDSVLVSLLTKAQPRLTGEELFDAPTQLIDIHSTLKSLLEVQETQNKQDINQIDEDLINLIAMLFEFILDDYNLSPPIQVLISRLQIPLLKVVIKDKSFFNNAQHPARQLLNSLAKAGIGWGDASEKQKDKLYNQIHHIVHRILDEFEGNIELFFELNKQFSEFMKKEEKKAGIIEQRTKEAERGRVKSQLAQQEVEKIMRNRLTNPGLPSEARDIIQSGWSRVMFLAYLKNDSQQSWNRSIKVLNELLWCLTPRIQTKERQRWVKVVPILLKEIRTGLQNVSYNATRMEEMISTLKNNLTAVFKEKTETRKFRYTPPEKKSQTAVEKQKEIEQSLASQYLDKVDALQENSWIEFSLVNGSKFRCKLSAHIDEGNCLIFVNRMGLKVIEKSREELAHEIGKGRVRVLEQGPLLDRALDSIVGSLRKKSNSVA